MRSVVLLFSGVMVFAAACGGKITGAGQGDGGPRSSSGSGSSGSGSSSSSSGGNVNSCLETSSTNQACISCIETECAATLGSVESACSDLLNCECPGGVFSETAAPSCSSLAQEPSCIGAAEQVDDCEQQNCESQCETSSGGGSGSGGGGSSSSGSSGGPPPAGCTVDDTIDCSGGATGYACAIGDNPEDEEPGLSLSCSTPAEAAGEVDFCCFSGGPWSPASCVPDDDLTAVCPDPDSYGYQCDAGDDPSEFDASLSCSVPTPDADGVHDDYCCTH
jgi:hypothetical protein